MPSNAEYAARFTILRRDLLARALTRGAPPPQGTPSAGYPTMPAALVRELETISCVIGQYAREHADDLLTDDSLTELATFTTYLSLGLPSRMTSGPILAALMAVRDAQR